MMQFKMPYEVEHNNLYKWVVSGRSTKRIHLCNFLPYLVSEKVYDNGVTTSRQFEVGGIFENGSELPKIVLSVAEFESMNWVTERWGVKCNMEAGKAIKEHIRHAIQTTGLEIHSDTIYTHSGWRTVDGKLKFLLDGMENSCQMEQTAMDNYHFPKEVTDGNASFELLHSGLAPFEILFPLVAFQYLAPLCHLLQLKQHMPKTILSLVGRTGSKKSSLSALLLSHFGKFSYDTLPLTFRDTGNSIVERLFYSKDLPTVIDDFHPTRNGSYEQADMIKTMQLVMRAFGDSTGRASLTQTRQLKSAKPPRGIGMITAEFSPNISESGFARMIEVKIKPTDIDMDKLTEWQERAKQNELSSAMKKYVLWLESCLENDPDFIDQLSDHFEECRKKLRHQLDAAQMKYHDRTPEACAFLCTSFYYFTIFLETENFEVESLRVKMDELLFDLAQKQSLNLVETSASETFTNTIATMIENELAFVPSKEKFINLQNDCIGFQDADFYYFNMASTMKLYRKFCLEQGEELPLEKKHLLRQLEEDEVLVPAEKVRTHSVKVSNGKNIRVAILRKQKFGRQTD